MGEERGGAMTETLFYHLEKKSLDDVLPGLVEKSRERGWRVLIRADTADRAQAIDTLLWTYKDESFLAHALEGDGEPSRQPVLITVEEHNPNKADVLFLVGGAVPSSWSDASLTALSRIVLLFDGRDPEMLAAARTAWKNAKAAGHDVTYWKETPAGKWEKQG
jgi:DNA polymerase-3 subunit chi